MQIFNLTLVALLAQRSIQPLQRVQKKIKLSELLTSDGRHALYKITESVR